MTLISVSVLLGVLGSLVAVFQALSEYRLKAQAQRAEIDINLSRLFAELVPIANGRQGTVVSEAGMTAVFSSPEIMQRLIAGVNDWERDVIREFAILDLPVGQAMQAAAVRSLGYLGEEYRQLREPASAALNALDYLAAYDGPLKNAHDGALEAIARAARNHTTSTGWRGRLREG